MARNFYEKHLNTPESRIDREKFVSKARKNISDFLKEVRDAEVMTAEDFRITITI